MLREGSPLRVLFISGREPTYVRNDVILSGLRRNHIDVIECTSCARSYLLRMIVVLVKFLFSTRNYDYNFVGFYGQILLPFKSGVETLHVGIRGPIEEVNPGI